MAKFQQRWLHFYFVNEALNLAFLVWLFSGVDVHIVGTSDALLARIPLINSFGLPRFIKGVLVYFAVYGAIMILMALLLVYRRSFRPAAKRLQWNPKFSQPKWTVKEVKTRDGFTLHVQTSRLLKGDKKQKVMLLAAPLGQCGPEIYAPITTQFGPEFHYITWDYRGFFNSTKTKSDRIRCLSVQEHAMDGLEVLESCGFDCAEVVVGHSMGVVVALEMSVLAPSKVGSLILLNGFHGTAFQTGFQPLCRFPFAGDLVSALLEFLIRRPEILDLVRRGIDYPLKAALKVYARLFASTNLDTILGAHYLASFMDSYLGTLCSSKANTLSFFLMFQELNAYSVYHLLPRINQKVLIVSGFLDMLTPPLQSVEIARRIPHAIHYCDPFSSHASILESPEWIIAEILEFVEGLDAPTANKKVD